jgi:hypothetical protein
MPVPEPASSNAKKFGEFPLSIRLAQRSIVLAILIPIALIRLRRIPWMKFAILAASCACGAVGILATYYAVIRYPYMGLVDAADGDLFWKYFESKSKPVRVAAVIACLLIALALIIYPMMDGQITGVDLLVSLYAIAVFCFVVFLMFFYERTDYPTVTTFLRCSMGIGIFLVPFFIPALVIGSIRANTLLDEAILKIEAEKKRSGLPS